MSIISLVVAMDMQRGIGFKNGLLCHLPADLKYFKSLTLGKPIIMGYRTFQSIGKPLPGRLNIVLTHQARHIEGVEVVHSLQEALACAKHADEVMIIGGERVFTEGLPFAQRIYVTEIHHQFEADVFFPKIDPNLWTRHVLSTRPRDEKNAFDITFCLYTKD